MKGERIKVGSTYGKLKVLSINSEKSYKCYICQCECGKYICYAGGEIHKYQDTGCGSCRSAARDMARLEYAKNSIGIRSGELEVIGISGIREYSDSNTIFATCKCDCGNIVEVPLAKIKAMQIRSCGHNRDDCLKQGRDFLKQDAVMGTRISSISTNKIRKNNTVGHTGISYHSGKYRAYITFKRKQYHLGLYDDISEAIKARETAEKELYGNFLEWYKNEGMKIKGNMS